MLTTEPNDGSLLSDATTAVGGYVGVKQLQEQLRRIAFEFGKGNVDPAQYDGKLTLGTIIALANAAPIAGGQIHPDVAKALDVVRYIKAPIKKLPYGDTIIEFILSPWIVDEVYAAILGIVRMIPGGSSAATAIDEVVKVAKTAISTAAAPIAAAFLLVKKSQPATGLGDDPAHPGFCWVPATSTVPGHWERASASQVCSALPPGGSAPSSTPIVRDHTQPGSSSGGGVTVTDTKTGAVIKTAVGLPPPTPGFPGVVRDHRDWPKGKAIVPTEWSRRNTFSGKATTDTLAPADLQLWQSSKDKGPAGLSTVMSIPGVAIGALTVGRGALPFKTFRGSDNARMGAFFDGQKQLLKIIVIPEPSSTKYPWDYAADAVKAAADAVGDAASAAGGAIADVAQDTWNWIAENADDVYRAVKKYGCAVVNNDIVVGLAAAGAGIVATPAASASVVAGASAGRAACTVLEVGELLYSIYKLLSMDIPKPPPLDTPAPPAVGPTKFTKPVRVLLPLTPPVVPLAKPRYPAGSIAAYDVKLKRYRIAIPVGTQLNIMGLGAVGTPQGLAAAASHFEVETTENAPPMVAVVPVTTFQKQTGTLPVYKNPVFWTAVGVSAVAVGGGSYAVYRRRRGLTR